MCFPLFIPYTGYAPLYRPDVSMSSNPLGASHMRWLPSTRSKCSRRREEELDDILVAAYKAMLEAMNEGTA